MSHWEVTLRHTNLLFLLLLGEHGYWSKEGTRGHSTLGPSGLGHCCSSSEKRNEGNSLARDAEKVSVLPQMESPTPDSKNSVRDSTVPFVHCTPLWVLPSPGHVPAVWELHPCREELDGLFGEEQSRFRPTQTVP